MLHINTCAPAYVSIWLHTCMPILHSICQHTEEYLLIGARTSAIFQVLGNYFCDRRYHAANVVLHVHHSLYVSIRQHASCRERRTACTPQPVRQHTPAYASIRHCGRLRLSARSYLCAPPGSYYRPAASAYVSIRHSTSQHTSAYFTWFISSTRSISIPQHTSAYITTYVSIRHLVHIIDPQHFVVVPRGRID